jgi:hypothetical protein
MQAVFSRMSGRRSILMGNPRPRPVRLASKLRHIREALELSQTQMLVRLGLDRSIEDIVDDDLDLPARLPGKIRYRGRRTRSRK